MMTFRERLNLAFVQALGLPDGTNVSELAYGKNRYWDSTAHMQLIAALEKEFDIMIDTDDVIAMSSYQVAVDILKKSGVPLDS